MIVPLGHDHADLRRWPVVTFAIIALAAAVFVGNCLAPGDDPQAIRAQLVAAVEYLADHPYLDADPRVRRVVEATHPTGSEDEEATESEDDTGARVVPSWLRQEEQRELDRLTGAWLAGLATTPPWRFGLVSTDYRADRLLTHLFVHLGVMHLFFNMLFLYFSGPAVEDAWGRALFGAFYLLAGAVSSTLFVVHYRDLGFPLVGASGAVAGVMGAFLVCYPRAQLRLLYFWAFRFGTFEISAWVALLLWVGGQALTAHVMDRLAPGTGGAGVAYWAHVWGFAFGAAVALVARTLKVEERVTQRLEGEGQSDPRWRETDRALRSGRENEAWLRLREHVVSDPSDRDAALAYWDLAEHLGRSRDAAPIALRLIRSELLAGEEETALRHWDELQERVPEVVVPLDLAVKIADGLRVNWRRKEAIPLIEYALQRVDARTAPDTLAELARVAAAIDDALGTDAVARALAHPGQPANTRAELEQLAADARARQPLAARGR